MIKVSCHQEGQILFCKNTTLILQKKAPETDIIKPSECLVDNTF